MPLAALVDKLAPPALAVVVPAAAKVPIVRTAASASALKSVGRVEAVVAFAGMPMPSKFCVYAVEVDKDMAAYTIKTDDKAASAIAANRTKKRDRDTDLGLNLDIRVPLVQWTSGRSFSGKQFDWKNGNRLKLS
jgi:hypothetical protein